jgi:hypothetical protein
MSNVGQAALTIVGLGVGFLTGNPALGFYIGNLAGNVLFPTKLPGVQGPRIGELNVQTSTIGGPIPKVYGTYLVAGNVIWSGGLQEIATTEEVGGKGGPSQSVTTYEYTVSIAVGLCEGPMAGVRRIWADADLIYDASTPSAWDGLTAEQILALIALGQDSLLYQQAANASLASILEFYPGSETQLPDPTIESYEGVGNVPAYRGLCYLVLRDFNVTKYGNRIPNIRVEVFDAGAQDCQQVTERSNEVLYPWIKADYPVNPRNKHEVRIGFVPGVVASGVVPGVYESVEDATAAAQSASGRTFPVYSGYANNGDDPDRTGRVNRVGLAPSFDVRDGLVLSLLFSQKEYERQVKRVGALSDDLSPSNGFLLGSTWWYNGSFLKGTWGGGGGVVHGWPIALQSSQAHKPEWDILVTGVVSRGYCYVLDYDLMLRIRRVPRAPPGPVELGGVPLQGSTDWYAMPDGSVQSGAPWTRVAGTCKVLQRYRLSFTSKTTIAAYPLGPVRVPSDATYNDAAFWTAAYEAAVAAGDMKAGLVYGVDYPEVQSYYYERTYDLCFADGDPISLADIVDDISVRVGVADADVSDLQSIEVHGYAITRQMSGRDAIEPLRSYGFFDAVESGGTAKFVTRGKSSVATLTEEDVAAHPAGEARPPAVKVTRGQDVELPVQMRVHYANPERDYEPAEQFSSRLATQSAHRVDLELAIAMSDAKAAQISEVLLYEAWANRMGYAFTLDADWLALDPGDAVVLPVSGRSERVRITRVTYLAPLLIQIDAVRDDAGVYDSSAVGVPGQGTGSAFNYTGPSELVLLDLPALRDADDDGGFYAAVRPVINVGNWRGAAIYRSVDGGASFSLVASSTTAVVMGVLVADSGSAPATVVDDGGSLLVHIYNGTLESRTEEAVLSGANTAAIGAHGRWEIVQFRSAELVGPGLWRLTSLRRGRRGTEHAIGEAVAGDAFVLLSAGGLVRIYQDDASIGSARQFKVVTFGALPSGEDPVQDFVGAGVALKPFSPVFLEAVREDDGDVRISWIRRGRLSQELRDGVEIPLSEASEAYEVDIVSGGVVLRTLSVTERLATYTYAQQLEDFGSPFPPSIDVRVYQLSAVVGRGYVAEATVLIELDPDLVGGVPVFDSDAIIVTGETKDGDEAEALIWAVQGSNTRRSDRGFVGDGYEFRISCSSGLPAWVTAGSSQPVTLRATIEPYSGPRNATADRLVSLCVNDATANPKLELAVVSDVTDSVELMVAARAYTGSMQTQRLFRRKWRFHWQFPIKTLSGYRARPQAVLPLLNGTVLVSAHYENQFSVAYQCERESGAVLGSFEFDSVTAYHVNALARRALDGTVWFDGDDKVLRRLDVDASLASGAAVVTGTFDCTAMAALSGIEWVVIDGHEYLLLGEYATIGTPYLYVIAAADVVLGGTFVLADRVKRLQLPLRCQGHAYLDGLLWLSVSVNPSGGRVYPVLLDDFIASGVDGDAWTAWAERPGDAAPRPPTAYAQDCKFDGQGRLWMCTEGLAGVDDADEFLCVWSSALGEAEENTVQLRYDGASSVHILVNDRLFVTKAWTPTSVPGVVSILGPPTGSASQTGGFAAARVWNVVIQESDLVLEDFSGRSTIYAQEVAQVWDLSLLNADAAEAPGAEWDVTVGELVRQSNASPYLRGQGAQSFFGGTSALSTAVQRVDLLDLFPDDFEDLETNNPQLWLVAEWLTSSWPSQSDRMDLTLLFYDVDGVLISSSAAPSFVPNQGATFIWRSYGFAFPAGTRYVDVQVDMVRTDGTNNNGHWDDLKVRLYGAQ